MSFQAHNNTTTAMGWKGKERATYVELDDRDEGAGGEDGVVLSLSLVGTGVYDA